MTTSRINIEIKSYDGEAEEHPNGSFTAILSTGALDRDDEYVDPYCFEPAPSSLPIFTDHESWSIRSLVARAVPSYDAEGRFVLSGHFGSDATSQEVRSKVKDGLITSMSVGFRNPTRVYDAAGKAHVVKAEAIEGSFVGIPANPEALITSAKSLEAADEDGVTDDIKTVTEDAVAQESHPEIAEQADAILAELDALEVLDEVGEVESLLDSLDDSEEHTSTVE